MTAPRLTQLAFIIGDACNAECGHCWQEARRKRTPKAQWFPEMSAGQFIAALDAFKNEPLQGVTLVSWGEPMANPAFGQMLWATHLRGLRFSLITNGSLLHRHCDVLATTPGDLTVSLDSLIPAKFEAIRPGLSFQEVTRNLLAVQKHPQKHANRLVGVNMVVMEQNVSEIPRIVDFCVSHRLAYLTFLNLVETPLLQDQHVPSADPRFQAGLSYARTFPALTISDQTGPAPPCELPFRELTIVSNGSTHPCCRTYNMATGTYDVTYGHFSQDPWNSETIKKLREQISNGFVRSKDFQSCAECEYLGVPSDAPMKKRLPVVS